MPQATCRRCGRPVKWVTLVPTRGMIQLDTIPIIDGPFRLSGTDNGAAERIERPGHQGYQKHDETCPALAKIP